MQNFQGRVVYDVDNNFGSDLSFGGQNDLLTVSEEERSKQHVLRRLLTAPLDYVWHPTYGAGLPSYIGQPFSADFYNRIKGRIQSQIFLESSVSKNPAPVITIQTIPNGLFVEISYTVYPSRQPVVLSFPVK